MKRVKHFLVVDDDPAARFLVELALEEVDIAENITYCENGQQAMDIIHAHYLPNRQYPELILLDLKMPVMDGYEFLEEFMKIDALKRKNIHGIVISSAAKKNERLRLESLPASSYIEKPITGDKLATLVSSLHF